MKGERLPHKTALVLAGGTLPATGLWPLLLEGRDLVIAADGGLAHARVLGVEPDLIVGDFDSVEAGDLRRYEHVPVERHPPEKDDLDLELALSAAWERGADHANVAGAFGDRLDQSFGALLIAARLVASGRSLALFAANHEARVVAAGGSLTRELHPGTTVSLLALAEDCVVSTSGVHYPLREAALPMGTGLGLSNAATGGPVELAVHAGVVALLVEHPPDEPKQAIWGAQAERISAALAAADPDLGALVERVAYGDVFARSGLDLAARELIALALLLAEGDVQDIPTHLRGALRVGASERQIRETIIHAAMFVGFPKALAAMRALERFLGDR